MFEIGTLCMKTAGRDAGLYCVIIDTPKEGYALVDGQTRRRVINTDHLQATEKKLDVKKGASHDDVVSALKKLKIEVRETKPKQAAAKPVKQRRGKAGPKTKRATEKKAKKEKPEKKVVKAEKLEKE